MQFADPGRTDRASEFDKRCRVLLVSGFAASARGVHESAVQAAALEIAMAREKAPPGMQFNPPIVSEKTAIHVK